METNISLLLLLQILTQSLIPVNHHLPSRLSFSRTFRLSN
jgi:hypothetical protein